MITVGNKCWVERMEKLFSIHDLIYIDIHKLPFVGYYCRITTRRNQHSFRIEEFEKFIPYKIDINPIVNNIWISNYPTEAFVYKISTTIDQVYTCHKDDVAINMIRQLTTIGE